MPNAMFPPMKLVRLLPVNVIGNKLGLLKVPVVEKLTEFATARHGTNTANAANDSA
jgi:hypothetical protein